MERQQREQVERNIGEAREKLETEMEAAKHEHQLMMMRQGGSPPIVGVLRFCTTARVVDSSRRV